MISEIRQESGTTMEIGRNMLFKLSGSSVRPAYPGFMVMKIPQDQTLGNLGFQIESLLNIASLCWIQAQIVGFIEISIEALKFS